MALSYIFLSLCILSLPLLCLSNGLALHDFEPRKDLLLHASFPVIPRTRTALLLSKETGVTGKRQLFFTCPPINRTPCRAYCSCPSSTYSSTTEGELMCLSPLFISPSLCQWNTQCSHLIITTSSLRACNSINRASIKCLGIPLSVSAPL